MRRREDRGRDVTSSDEGSLEGWRGTVHEIIYEADTPAGKLFDVSLIIVIALSIVVVMLETVESVSERFGVVFRVVEWVVTVLFTIEYVLRLICVKRPLRYATSFFGVIDLFAILPTYLSFFFPSTRFLSVIRVLRMLRVFRVLKLARYLSEFDVLIRALKASRVKITVFLYSVLAIVVVVGSVMYVVEGPYNDGFDSIPRSIYWAIVTLTTVGYGDISPRTALGQALSAVVMVLGYAIIAVPTGIVTVELGRVIPKEISTMACCSCSHEGHDSDAKFCKHCGEKL